MTDHASRAKTSTGTGDTRRRLGLEWVLLRGDRTVVAAGVVALLLAVFVAFSVLGPVALEDGNALFYVYSGLIAGNLTLITVVVSINQLLLSRELQTPGELREQIGNVVEYRREVEQAAGEIAPVEPQGFLRLLVETTREDAQRLGGLVRGDEVRSGEGEIDAEVEDLTERLDRVDRLLRESDEDTINVLWVLLETNYAREINRLRRIEAEHGDGLSEPVRDAIDGVVDRLQEIDVARQYFKSIYLQQELSSLSRILLYVGLPAVATAVASLLVLTVPPGEPEAIRVPTVSFPATIAVGLAPLATLCSYILRMATVTNLTAATLPFTTPEQER